MSPAPRKLQEFSAHARSRARRLATQALYQWQLTGDTIAIIESQFQEVRDLKGADLEYFKNLLQQISILVTEIDGIISPALDRKLEDLDPVEHAILRIGAYELAHQPDIPYRVVLNEAVILTKKFGAAEAHTYVNGVLDKVAHTIRSEECGTR